MDDGLADLLRQNPVFCNDLIFLLCAHIAAHPTPIQFRFTFKEVDP